VTSFWCEHAWLGGDQVRAGVLVEVEGDSIVAVERAATSPAGATRLSGVTLPGLVNAHSHAFHRALRGRTHAGGGTFWTWREQMYALASRLDPDRYLALARATYAEMALAGITTVGEFHYLHHDTDGRAYVDANAMGSALAQAAADAGIRLTLLDTCYLHGGIDRPLEGVQPRFSDGSVAQWAERTAGLASTPLVRHGVAIHSIRAVTPIEAGQVAGVARARGQVVHAHVSEQPAENQVCLSAYGASPARVLADAGAVSERFTAVHATHLVTGDAAQLAPATVCLCPTTERDLADGIGPAAALTAAGARLCLGTDSHAVIDLLEEARGVELDERLGALRRGVHAPSALLRTATAGGAAALGWPEAGRIEAGSPADLVTIATTSVRLAGTPPEALLAGIVFAGTAGDVTHVMVGGRTIVSEGSHVSLDVPGELSRAIAAVWA